MNKAILLGNLGNDPEVKYTQSGSVVLSFSLATTENYKGEKKTEWHRVTCFGKLAEICQKYLGKGSKVLVEGKIEYQKWQDRNGNQRQTTVIIANSVEFLSQRQENNYQPTGEDEVPF